MNQKFKPCAAQSCERNAHRCENGKLGYCSLHYQRLRRHGDPEARPGVPRPALDWIEQHATHKGDDCLKWPFHIGKDGYGRIHDPSRGSVLTTASRFMLEQAKGPAPSEIHECAHSCGMGNQGCVNPNHLYWATPTENQADRVKHKTSNRGERQWQSRLTASNVLEIRRLVSTHTQTSLAKRFGVDPSTISNIKTGKHWSWLK